MGNGGRTEPVAPVAELIPGALTGRLNRRQVLRRSAALGLAAPAVAALLERAPSAGAQATPAASGEPIRPGAIYNLTGGLSSIDVPARDGSLLAVKELNAAGGVLGRPLELLVEDGKTDLTTVTNATKKLLDEDKVPVLVGITDTTFALPVAGAAQEAGVPFLTVGATAPVIAETGDYVFLLPFGDNVQAAVAAEFANKKGWKTAAVLLDNQMDYTKFLAQYFADRFDDDDIGGQIVSELNYASGDTDFSSQLTEIKNLDPQPNVLFISSGPNEIGTIIKQARDLGITLPILGGDGYDTPQLLQLAPNASNVFFTTHEGIYGEESAAKAFNAAFEAEYGSPPASVFAALGYDGVKLMADAINRAGDVAGDKVRDALAATKDFKGVTGTISYEPGQRVPSKTVSLIEVKDGKFNLLENVTPKKVPPA